MNIVLCGMMGAGKTAVASALGKLSGRTVVDTDALIVAEHGRIADIFATYGESYFRDLETETLVGLSERDGLVVATGGGSVLRERNVAALKKNGTLFYLRAKEETLVKRVEGDTERPLLAGGAGERIASLMKARSPVYERAADHIVDTDLLSPEQIAEIILKIAED